MFTIGIDCRFAGTHSGIGRYTRELTAALLRRSDPWQYVLFVRNPEENWLQKLPSDRCQIVQADLSHYSLSEQTKLPSLLRKAGIDLLFSPHFNVPVVTSIPTVITVHDLILHRYPNEASFFKQAAYKILLYRAVKRAKKIICVSAFTETDVQETYGRMVKRKTRVIHEAVSPQFTRVSEAKQQSVRKKYNLERPFFLYVGNAKQHKNVQVLLDAFAALQESNEDLVLVISGKERTALPQPLPDRVRLLDAVSDADLPALYSSAKCFVSASLCEGFGLPLLEAYACGCPAIVSDRGSFPEIAPPGTLLIEPVADAFTEAMESPPKRILQPVALRTWDDVASDTVTVLRELVDAV